MQGVEGEYILFSFSRQAIKENIHFESFISSSNEFAVSNPYSLSLFTFYKEALPSSIHWILFTTFHSIIWCLALYKSVATPFRYFLLFLLLLSNRLSSSTWYTETAWHIYTSTHNRIRFLVMSEGYSSKTDRLYMKLSDTVLTLVWFIRQILISRWPVSWCRIWISASAREVVVTDGVANSIPEAHAASLTLAVFMEMPENASATLNYVSLAKAASWSSGGDVQVPPTRWES
jgi:hypothetical protein